MESNSFPSHCHISDMTAVVIWTTFCYLCNFFFCSLTSMNGITVKLFFSSNIDFEWKCLHEMSPRFMASLPDMEYYSIHKIIISVDGKYSLLFPISHTIPSNLWYKRCLSRQWNCWSLRCRWSSTCQHCSKYIFILDLTPGFNGLDKDNCKTRWETFKFGDLVHRILEIWRQCLCATRVLLPAILLFWITCKSTKICSLFSLFLQQRSVR